MTENQKIERAREVRLWLTQIVAPAGIATAIIMRNDNARLWVKDQWCKVKSVPNQIKLKIKNRPRKGKVVGEK